MSDGITLESEKYHFRSIYIAGVFGIYVQHFCKYCILLSVLIFQRSG